MGTTKSHRNLRIFCPLLGFVHYWELLLNKNGWEAEFCPLLGAFSLLGSALLGEYSVCRNRTNIIRNYDFLNHILNMVISARRIGLEI